MNIEHMLDVEDRHKLLEKKYDGFTYWVYCRHYIWQKYIVPLKTDIVDVREGKESFSRLLGDSISLVRSSITNSSIQKKNYDICFMNHERRQRTGEYYQCIYTEFLSNYFENSYTIERTYQHRHLRPVETRNLIYIDRIEVQSNLYSLINRTIKSNSYKRIKLHLRNELETSMKELGKLYDISIDLDYVCEIIIKFYYIYKLKKRYFEKMLKTYRPRIVVEVVGYNMDCMIVNELTYGTETYTVEFEHGIIGREHLAYSYCRNNGEKCIRQFPQNLYVFSNYFIKQTKLPKTHVWEMGYPFLEFMKEKYPPKGKRENGLTMLFISQTQNGWKLAPIAEKCAMLMKNDGIHIIYKLHPKEMPVWKELYPELLANNIEVIDTLDINIYECFSRSDIQVGGNSTAIYEGLSYGLETYIVNYEEIGEAADLCSEGVAAMFDNAEELIRLIQSSHGTQMAVYKIWKDNAPKAYVCGLKELLDET